MRLEEVLVRGVTVAASVCESKLERLEASGRDVRRECALDAAGGAPQDRPGLQLVVQLAAFPIVDRGDPDVLVAQAARLGASARLSSTLRSPLSTLEITSVLYRR